MKHKQYQYKATLLSFLCCYTHFIYLTESFCVPIMLGKYQCQDGCGTFNIYIWFSISCGYKLAINHLSEDGEVKDGLINGTFNVMGRDVGCPWVDRGFA